MDDGVEERMGRIKDAMGETALTAMATKYSKKYPALRDARGVVEAAIVKTAEDDPRHPVGCSSLTLEELLQPSKKETLGNVIGGYLEDILEERGIITTAQREGRRR